jgi:hypothetical protein
VQARARPRRYRALRMRDPHCPVSSSRKHPRLRVDYPNCDCFLREETRRPPATSPAGGQLDCVYARPHLCVRRGSSRAVRRRSTTHSFASALVHPDRSRRRPIDDGPSMLEAAKPDGPCKSACNGRCYARNAALMWHSLPIGADGSPLVTAPSVPRDRDSGGILTGNEGSGPHVRGMVSRRNAYWRGRSPPREEEFPLLAADAPAAREPDHPGHIAT